MVPDNRLYTLLLRHFSQEELSEKEQEEIALLVQEYDNEALKLLLTRIWGNYHPHTEISDTRSADMLNKIFNKPRAIETQPPVRRMFLARRWAWVAASVILFFAAGTYFWLQQAEKSVNITAVSNQDLTIEAGKTGAILTLADGRTMVLDSMGSGVIANQNGSQVILQDGQLAYAAGGTAGEIAYNTMTTPKGRQFAVVLSDGTKVWLNAASSIRYPTSFSGTQRKIEVSGEAYFEVTPNAQMPFVVSVSEQTAIEVLGTSFNVNAYTNEAAIKTTLLEGAVRVITSSSYEKQGVLLHPGQQASVSEKATTASGQRITVTKDADVNRIMAWKNGLFNFDEVRLEEAMRQLERWYNIEVVYENGVPDIRFWGKIGRDVPLNGLLNMLKGSKLNVRMEQGRKLVILNN